MSVIKIYVNNEIAELKDKDEITSGDISTVRDFMIRIKQHGLY